VGTVISILREQGLVTQAAKKGEYFINALKKLVEEFPFIIDIRGRGLMFGVEISPDYARYGDTIQESFLHEGYLMDFHDSTNTFRFFPPYVISYEEIDSFIMTFRKTLTLLK